MIERSEISCFKLTPTEKEYLREAAAHPAMTISALILDVFLSEPAFGSLLPLFVQYASCESVIAVI